ncbi:MAG: hypothetical protein AB1726_00600 [Planctomycetota bacterium]
MKRHTVIAVLAVLIGVPAVLAEDPPCIPEGESTELTYDRPDLKDSGMPASAEWTGKDGSGQPEARDKDYLNDDSMGAATPSADGEQASVTLRNSGGEIYGPNGEDVTAGLEGDCVEVYVRWTYWYRYWENSCTSHTSSGGKPGYTPGSGGSDCRSTEKWGKGVVQSDETYEVCPC